MALTEDEIKRMVREQLDWDARLDAANIDVDLEDHRVILNGTVPSYLDRQVALRDAYAVQDIGYVDNNLTVKYPKDQQAIPDAQIKDIMQKFIAASPGFFAPGIDILVQSQVIYLEGTVKAYWEKAYLHDIAERIPGIVEVVNWLTVSPTEEIPDERIKNDLVEAIRRNAQVDARDVQVDVRRGVVTLSGAVLYWSARQKVRELAESTRGVKDVINNIRILLTLPGTPAV